MSMDEVVTPWREMDTAAEPYAVHKRPVGRPKTITDMRAYKAQKQREYRAAKRLALSKMPKGDGNE